jgi:hypothetical protein
MTYTNSNTAAQSTSTTDFQVKIDPTPVGMYVGALVGLFLGSLFLLIFQLDPLSSPQSAGAASRKTAPLVRLSDDHRLLADFFFRVARGMVATALAVLLFQTTSNLNFITIAIHDFYGGVLLGLFADKIGRTIYDNMMKS